MRSETLVRLNRLVPSNRLKFLAVLAADLLRVRHLIVFRSHSGMQSAVRDVPFQRR